MSNPPMYFGNIMYFITETGATISIDDFNSLSTAQQEKCKFVYYDNEKYEINPEFAEVFKEPYGWVIEQNSTGKVSYDGGATWKWTPWTGWHPTLKHKVYKTKEIALEAVKSKNDGPFSHFKISYRIIPVYSGEPEVLDNILDLPLKIEEDGNT